MNQWFGYLKYDYQNKEMDDSRNGCSHKTVAITNLILHVTVEASMNHNIWIDEHGCK